MVHLLVVRLHDFNFLGGAWRPDGHCQPQCWRHQDKEGAGESQLLWLWCKEHVVHFIVKSLLVLSSHLFSRMTLTLTEQGGINQIMKPLTVEIAWFCAGSRFSQPLMWWKRGMINGILILRLFPCVFPKRVAASGQFESLRSKNLCDWIFLKAEIMWIFLKFVLLKIDIH